MVQAVIYEHYTQLFIIIVYSSPRYIKQNNLTVNRFCQRVYMCVNAFICAVVRLYVRWCVYIGINNCVYNVNNCLGNIGNV